MQHSYRAAQNEWLKLTKKENVLKTKVSWDFSIIKSLLTAFMTEGKNTTGVFSHLTFTSLCGFQGISQI